jgi:hypothetical protein
LAKKKDSIASLFKHIDTTVQPKIAKTICEFNSNEKNYLSYEMNQCLIIYNKYFEDFYIAKDNSGQIGLVFEFNVEIIQGIFLLIVNLINK